MSPTAIFGSRGGGAGTVAAMQLEPRYGNQSIITMDATFPRPGEALAEQRQRQDELFAKFDERHWASSTRCPGWTVRDLVAHLVTANEFFLRSVRAGLAGEPSTVLAGFDPAVHPDKLLEALAEHDGPAVAEQYRLVNDALIDTVADLSPEQWSMTAESPVGHVAIDRVIDHALWDALVHEHDIRLDHDMPVAGSLVELGIVCRYAAAAGPAMGNMGIDGFTGTIEIDPVDLNALFTVEVSTSVAVFSTLR